MSSLTRTLACLPTCAPSVLSSALTVPSLSPLPLCSSSSPQPLPQALPHRLQARIATDICLPCFHLGEDVGQSERVHTKPCQTLEKGGNEGSEQVDGEAGRNWSMQTDRSITRQGNDIEVRKTTTKNKAATKTKTKTTATATAKTTTTDPTTTTDHDHDQDQDQDQDQDRTKARQDKTFTTKRTRSTVITDLTSFSVPIDANLKDNNKIENIKQQGPKPGPKGRPQARP